MMQERMYSANEYADAQDRILTLEGEVERLNQGLAAMVMSTTYRCTHCGVRPQSEEALREHCRTCPKHPARVEVEQLKAELADWRDASRRIMAEECAPDEKHCTCVPALREEIERLRTVIAAQPSGEPFIDALDDADAEVKRLKGILKERQAEIRTHQAEVEQLQAMIPTKPEGADRLFWLMKPVLAKPFVLGEKD